MQFECFTVYFVQLFDLNEHCFRIYDLYKRGRGVRQVQVRVESSQGSRRASLLPVLAVVRATLSFEQTVKLNNTLILQMILFEIV